jgi:hypothetical protein
VTLLSRPFFFDFFPGTDLFLFEFLRNKSAADKKLRLPFPEAGESAKNTAGPS